MTTSLLASMAVDNIVIRLRLRSEGGLVCVLRHRILNLVIRIFLSLAYGHYRRRRDFKRVVLWVNGVVMPIPADRNLVHVTPHERLVSRFVVQLVVCRRLLVIP